MVAEWQGHCHQRVEDQFSKAGEESGTSEVYPCGRGRGDTPAPLALPSQRWPRPVYIGKPNALCTNAAIAARVTISAGR